jgi:hypothetical protein
MPDQEKQAPMTNVMVKLEEVSLPQRPFSLYTFQYKRITQSNVSLMGDEHGGRSRQVMASRLHCVRIETAV